MVGKLALLAAQNETTPAFLLAFLAKSDNLEVQKSLVRNPNTPAGIIKHLAKNNVDVCLAAVENPWACAAVLHRALAHLLNVEVSFIQNETNRISVARGKNSEAILNILAKDTNIGVLKAVAQNINASADALEFLSRHKDPKIRTIVAANRATPTEVVARLMKDPSPFTQKAAVRSTKAPLDALCAKASSLDFKDRAFVAGNFATPLHVLEALSQDADVRVRIAVAKNGSTPSKCLNLLAQDKEIGVRMGVCKNCHKNITSGILNNLKNDKNEQVRTAALNMLKAKGWQT